MRLCSRAPSRLARRLLALVLGCAALAGCARLAAADLEEILVAKVLRVGMTATDAPPLLQTVPAGAPGGLEGDFIAEVARRMDVKLTFIRTARTAEELIAQVVASEVDIGIGQLTDSLEWAKSVRFSRSYVQLQEFRLVDRLATSRAGGAGRLLADKGSRILALAGSVVLPTAREEFGAQLQVVPSMPAAVEAVLTGGAVAVIADDITVSRWLHANPAAAIRLELIPRRDRPLHLTMAVNWKSDDLQAWLNLCIEKCLLDGTLPSLVAKNLGDNRPRPHP